MLRRSLLAAAALAAACALTGPASAAICGLGTYSYAGYGSRAATNGVRATIASVAPLDVRDGHVAGWVGVGGQGLGPRGTDAWLQIGLNALPNDRTNRIYYEIARPGRQPVYHELRSGVGSGERHQFAVLELPRRPGWWRAWVDGAPVSPPVFMPGSHDRWPAQILGESWMGNASSGNCNAYGYTFDRVGLANGSLWHAAKRLEVFRDPNYRLVRHSVSSFLAASAVSPPERLPAAATTQTAG